MKLAKRTSLQWGEIGIEGDLCNVCHPNEGQKKFLTWVKKQNSELKRHFVLVKICFGLFKNRSSKNDDYFIICKTKNKNAASTWIEFCKHIKI